MQPISLDLQDDASRSYSVWITTDSHPVPIYSVSASAPDARASSASSSSSSSSSDGLDDDTDDERQPERRKNKVTGYIESKAGQEFVIHASGPEGQMVQVIPFGDGVRSVVLSFFLNIHSCTSSYDKSRWGSGAIVKSKQKRSRFNVKFAGLRNSEVSSCPSLFC